MRILVLFVEPMLYGMDLIHEVYEKTEYEYRYVYCTQGLTGKDAIQLPSESFVCSGDKKGRKRQICHEICEFRPDFVVINGYVGVEQTAAILYCQKHGIKYAIESDTPLHIPHNKIKALGKKLYLRKLLRNRYCYGFPGGTPQKENLVYYGIPEEKNYIMPMSVSRERILNAAALFPTKESLKSELGLEGKTIFLFVGRVAPEKNVGLLLESFATLKSKREDIALVIVGDGTEAEALKQKTKRDAIKDVLFAGYVVFPELIKYYKIADVLVLPSVHEPWGLVVNEAMTMGLPVMVSNQVGCREDLLKGLQRTMIFQCDDRTELSDKMELLLENYVQYADCSSNFSWNYSYYLKCYKESLSKIL